MNDAIGAEEKEKLEAECQHWSKWSNRGSKSWSLVYHLSFGLAAILGVTVAAVSNNDGFSLGSISHSALISILSLAAAVLTTIGGFGGFERKWRTNRATRAALEILEIDKSDPKFTTADLRNRLREIIVAHETGIMASDQSGKALAASAVHLHDAPNVPPAPGNQPDAHPE
jgi:Protein of unknown function (DUF4231)